MTAQTAEKTKAVSIVPEAQQAVTHTPMDLLNQAVANGNIELAEKLMGLHERWEKNQARKAFDHAMAAAKSEIPVITKNREVDFTSQKGRTNYKHEDMAGIAKIVDPILSRYGLSYRYRVSSNPNEPVNVTCIISHRDGHSEETTLVAGRDETGNKNSIQGVGSTLTYLQRYSLKAALGLAASNDDDGKAAGGDSAAISDEQADEIRDLITATKADVGRFLKWAGAESVADLPASKFKEAVAMLNAKKTQTAGAAS